MKGNMCFIFVLSLADSIWLQRRKGRTDTIVEQPRLYKPLFFPSAISQAYIPERQYIHKYNLEQTIGSGHLSWDSSNLSTKSP